MGRATIRLIEPLPAPESGRTVFVHGKEVVEGMNDFRTSEVAER